ncbi:MAG TPA: serine/threonine-protein kinase [Ktedonobacterales bacterium]
MAGQEAGHEDGARPRDALIGQTLGSCAITQMLGQGGMARVYRARQDRLDRDVAIKVLPPYYAADPDFVERFKQEARALAKFSHPNIVVVHDAGEDRGLLYIIMEYVPGGNLRDYMRQSLSLDEVTRIIHEVAGALTYAHERGVIHRDVKPVNVLLDLSKRAVLSDFGIAKVLATSAAVSRSGAGVGTPEYMSPEQCHGGQVDARTDIYALGVMLYEMLTGHTPFEADNYTALAHSHIYEPVPPPSRYNPRISIAVQSVVLKALEKDPANRFQSAVEMATTLEQAAAAQSPLPPGERRQMDARDLPDEIAVGAQQTTQQLVTCPNCHAANYATQRFCSTCGQPFGPPRTGGPSSPMPSVRTGAVGAAGAYGMVVAPQPNSRWLACPNCQLPNQPLNRFCTRCGFSMLQGVAGRACRNCGMRNVAGTRFCTSCGAPMG